MMGEDQAVEVVVTAPDKDLVRELIHALMQKRLCAAGHLYPFETTYRWRGNVYEKTEVRGILYTRASLVDRITEEIRSMHPYEVPHVTATPLVAGNDDYLQWIFSETSTA